MNLSMPNRALLRGILAGAMVLSGVSACSRSNRADAGRDTTQSGATAVTPADTQTSANASQPSAGAATQPSGDTAVTTARDSTTATAPVLTPRQRSASGRSAGQDSVKASEEAVSGYREMERDPSNAVPDSASAERAGTGAASPLDPAGLTSDYALTGDTTTAAGYSEMARDTSSAAGQGDTTAGAVIDSTAQVEADTADTQGQTTPTTAPAEAQPDTTTAVHTDTLAVAEDKAGRIRPPEDSTETLGSVTSDSAQTSSAAAGAAALRHTVTGIDAVAVMTRAGVRCVVKNDSNDVWWDMADSPAALNPCGTGTMTLSLVRTGEK
jgi:hypothetical protein